MIHRLTVHIRTDKPKPLFFQFFHRLNQIRHFGNRSIIQCPCRSLCNSCRQPDCPSFGMITPCAPARFAVLIIAPRLCGSSILSRIRIKGSSPRSSASASISSTVEYSYAAAYATTPDAFRSQKSATVSLLSQNSTGHHAFCFSYNRSTGPS